MFSEQVELNDETILDEENEGIHPFIIKLFKDLLLIENQITQLEKEYAN